MVQIINTCLFHDNDDVTDTQRSGCHSVSALGGEGVCNRSEDLTNNQTLLIQEIRLWCEVYLYFVIKVIFLKLIRIHFLQIAGDKTTQ